VLNELSPSKTDESLLHRAAKKSGLAVSCELKYLDLPVCTGYSDSGEPIVEIQPWPFLLPSDLETWLQHVATKRLQQIDLSICQYIY